jgi:hypothetical protein
VATAPAGADREEGEAQVNEEDRREKIARLARLGMYRHADGYVYRRSGVVCDPRTDQMVAYGWDAAIHVTLARSQAA